MLFASLTFLLGFLPVVIAGTIFVNRVFGLRATLLFVSLASFVFYGWHYPPHIVLLACSISFNYLIGHLIQRHRAHLLVTMGVVLNLGLLGWFKYAGFLAEMIQTVSGSQIGLMQIILPLGISFFTFQQIAYLVDIHQRKATPGDALEYVFFISFFPQLIAGPIVHHKGFIAQLGESRFANFRPQDVSAGALLFCFGLAKKVLIADNLAPGADALFQAEALGVPISMAESWLGMLCYTFQIYFDFSGYTDMALGLGMIFGLRLPENFRSPYKSRDIVEFWRRWNITLSTFLRDYLYVPLGGNRHGRTRRYINLWIVMLLGGLWHGAGMQFLIWGALHGFYLMVNHWWLKHRPRPLPAVLGWSLTMLAVVVAWVFFRAADVDQGLDVLVAMFGIHAVSPLEVAIYDDLPKLCIMIAVAGALAIASPNAFELLAQPLQEDASQPTRRRWFALAGFLAALSLFHLYASGSHAFIYFQF